MEKDPQTVQKLSPEEVDFTLRNVIAIHEHEGVRPSDRSIELGRLVLEDKITGDEAVKMLIEEWNLEK